MNLAVDMRSISKRFGLVQALEEVDLQVESGTIHALVGENGAGKTTLMRVLYGAIHPDHGEYKVETEAHKSGMFHNSAEAIRAGIGMVSQHYSIIPDLTCLENLMLGAEPGWVIAKNAATARAEELAQRMNFTFNWSAEASTLSPAGAQKLEILKLLWRNSRIMILDEPTAMLSPADSDALFASLRKLAKEGATIIVVTHRLPEVMQHCKRATVLRGGKLVANREVSETNVGELAELIVGHSLSASKRIDIPLKADPLLKVTDLTVIGSRGEEALKKISFTLKKGEVLGIAGVDGSGQRELFQALMGELKASTGEVVLGDDELSDMATMERLRIGVRLIPEDRHAEAVVEEWSLDDNAALGLQRFPPFASRNRVNLDSRKEAATRMAQRFNTKHGGIDLPIASLSGGNQQRFVAGRALFLSPRLVLAFQPARGLDIDATRNLYNAFREECDRGAGVLVVSFDLDEILEYCDRTIVMNLGRVHHPNEGEERDRQAIGRLMVGAA